MWLVATRLDNADVKYSASWKYCITKRKTFYLVNVFSFILGIQNKTQLKPSR